MPHRMLPAMFLAEVDHTCAAAAAAVAALSAAHSSADTSSSSNSSRSKVFPWDAGRLFSTTCATFLLLSPLNCFFCRYDASFAAAPGAAASSSSTRAHRESGGTAEGRSSRGSSRDSSCSYKSSSSMESCSAAALSPQQQLKVAFSCRCECCGSRLGGDGRGIGTKSRSSSKESVRIAFHISTFRTEEHTAVIDALLPPAYATAVPATAVGAAPNSVALAVAASDFVVAAATAADAHGICCNAADILLRDQPFALGCLAIHQQSDWSCCYSS